MKDDFKITVILKGKNLSYESEISSALAAQIMSACLSGERNSVKKINELSPVISMKVADIDSKTSPAEFLNKYGPKRNPDKILALAVYLKHHDNRSKFNPGEIKRLFRDAGEVLPANFTRDFKWVISSGWIARDSDEKDAYYVTTTGCNVLEQGFPIELIKKSAQNKMLNRRKKRVINKN